MSPDGLPDLLTNLKNELPHVRDETPHLFDGATTLTLSTPTHS
jgi:hypothetical protein